VAVGYYGGVRLWLVPLTGLLAGLGLAIGALALDSASGYDLVSQSVTGTPTAASSLLSTIITSDITLLSVVLTVMTVAVQLAMGQFSPRIVGALLRDPLHQFAFALVGATVAFGIVGLIGVDDQKGQVPGLTVLTTYVLAVASLATLVIYVSHAGQRLRATGLIDLVGDQLHVEIAKRFPAVGGPPLPPDAVRSASAGVVAKIEVDGLVAAAAREGCVLELCVRMGDFIPRDAPLLRVHGAEAARLADTAKLVVLHDERTHDLDPAFGVRKLVDIAVRSASEDPTTTVEALHRIHDSLRQLAWRPFPSGRHTDAAGELRLIVPVRDWEDFVRLAFEEIRLAGAAQPQIARGLRAVLEDLKTVAPDERQAALDEQRELLDAAVRRAYDEESVTHHARVADLQGLG
jgi:uncharacterized membrane protein